MDYEIKNVSNVSVVCLVGELTSGKWVDALWGDLQELQSRTVVFDLAEVSYVNSSGLRRMIEIHSRLGANGRILALATLQQPVLDIFVRLRLFTVIPIFHSLEESIEAYAQSRSSQPPSAPDTLPQVSVDRDFAPDGIKRFLVLLEQCTDPLVVKDCDGKVLYANACGRLMLDAADGGSSDYMLAAVCPLAQASSVSPARILLYRRKGQPAKVP